jgi:hypothetical protein
MLLITISATLLPAPGASANDLQIIQPDDAKSAIWENATHKKIRDTWRRVETTLINGFLLEGGNKTTITRALNKLRADFRKSLRVNEGGDLAARMSYDNMVRTMFGLASKDADLRGLVKPLWIRLGTPALLEGDLTESQKIVLAESVRRNMPNHKLLERERAMNKDTIRRAKQDPVYAQQYDSLFADELDGLTLSNFDPRAYLAQDSSNPLHKSLLDNMRPDGGLEFSLNELKELTRTEFGKINTSIDDMQRTLGLINAQQQDLVDFMNNERALQEAQALAQAEAAEHDARLAAASSAVTTLSTLAGIIDPRFGEQVGVVGSSIVQIGDTLSGWMKATAGLSALEQITSLSTVLATGNALGAVMNIVSLFGDSGPTPDQMILEEIGKLREQIDQLGVEMHDRFDRIDKQLNTIYNTMQERFDQIDLQLGKINGNLAEIQQSLLNLDMRLSRLERNNFEFLDAIGRRPLLDSINGAIGYRERTGLAMPFQPEFVSFENTFHTWGTVTAFDALSAGPTQRDYRDSQVLSELNAYPLDANLNYLNGWLMAKGLTPFSSKRLPSPRDWLFASRSYSLMGTEWPEHVRRIDPQRGASLAAVGADLEQALRNLSTRITPSGPAGNAPLFTEVISYYSAKLNQIDTHLLTSELAFASNVQLNELQRGEPFDLFGGIEQPLAYKAPGLATMSCGEIATPSNMAAHVPNLVRYTMAEYMKLGTIRSCPLAVLENIQLICPPRQDACDMLGDLRIYVRVSFDNVMLTERSLAAGILRLPGEEDVTDYVIANWGNYKENFEQRSVDAPLLPRQVEERAAKLAEITAALQARLAAYQQNFSTQVLQGLQGQNNSPLRPMSVELAGAKKLLESFIALGLPQTLSSDDLLRSLLYSDQALVDDQQVVSAYTTAMTTAQVGEGAGLMSDPRIALMGTATKRTTAMRDLLTRYTDAISAQTYREEIELITNARRDLDLVRGLADLPADQPPVEQPPTTNTQRLYLPLVLR